jgi:hypothetical protein
VLTHTRPATLEAIGDERLAWLRALPLRWSDHDLTVVHAVPDNAWPLVAANAPDEEMERVYDVVGTTRVVYGHIHVPFVRGLPTCTVVNAGAVSQSFDGDPRASYALIDGEHVEIRRVEYDVEAEIRLLMRSDDPLELCGTVHVRRREAQGSRHGWRGRCGTGTLEAGKLRGVYYEPGHQIAGLPSSLPIYVAIQGAHHHESERDLDAPDIRRAVVALDRTGDVQYFETRLDLELLDPDNARTPAEHFRHRRRITVSQIPVRLRGMIKASLADRRFLVLGRCPKVVLTWRVSVPFSDAAAPLALNRARCDFGNRSYDRASGPMTGTQVRMRREELAELVDALPVSTDGPVDESTKLHL